MNMLVVFVAFVAVVVVSLGWHFDHNSLVRMRVWVWVRMGMLWLRSMVMVRFLVDMRRIVPVNVGEVLLEHLKTPQVLIALGLSVLPLGAVFIQDEI